MEYTARIFDLHNPDIKPDNRVNTTLAQTLALYVVIYSPHTWTPFAGTESAPGRDPFKTSSMSPPTARHPG
jgi:hypothetical protein